MSALSTAVTSAPACLASATTNTPPAPPAPLTRTRSPGRTSAVALRAMPPACGIVEASANDSPPGFRANSLGRVQTNSASPPRYPASSPNTSSPTAYSVTALPTAATTPATSDPGTGCRGRRSPLDHRAYAGLPARFSRSEPFKETARTRSRTSLSAGTGSGSSPNRRTSGGPYLSWMTACIGTPVCDRRRSRRRPMLRVWSSRFPWTRTGAGRAGPLGATFRRLSARSPVSPTDHGVHT